MKTKIRAREEKVEKLDELARSHGGDAYRVSVKESPVHNQANEAVIRLLAKHFNTSVQNVRIVSGHTKTQKVVEIS